MRAGRSLLYIYILYIVLLFFSYYRSIVLCTVIITASFFFFYLLGLNSIILIDYSNKIQKTSSVKTIRLCYCRNANPTHNFCCCCCSLACFFRSPTPFCSYIYFALRLYTYRGSAIHTFC